MLLSVVVPVYKQGKTIIKDIGNIETILKQIRYDYEMIVVVDGKKDDPMSFQAASSYKSVKVKVIAYENNHGKGYAVRYGMARCKGDVIAFIDSGMDINPNGLSIALEHMEWYQADIIVGSKRHPASKGKFPLKRRIYSLGYQILTWILFGLNVRDTQTGLKIFKRKVLEDVLPRLMIKQFALDVEMLSVARHLGYKRIFEAPIELIWRGTSTISSKYVISTLVDTLAVFYRLKILHYYDDCNKRKWVYDPDLHFQINVG